MMNTIELPPGSGERMGARLRLGLASGGSRGRRTKMIAAGVIGATVIGGGTAGATAILMASQQAQTRSAYCYSAADVNSQYTQVGLPAETYGQDGTTTIEPTREDRAAFALDLCGSVWRAGIFDLDNERLPDLVACVRDDGVPAVFPRDGGGPSEAACAQLGLGHLTD